MKLSQITSLFLLTVGSFCLGLYFTDPSQIQPYQWGITGFFTLLGLIDIIRYIRRSNRL